MKKMLAVAVVVALAVPALAWSAPAKPGKYEGSITSVVPDLNGKKVTAEVKTEGTNTVATVVYPDSTKEVWTWNEKTLDQKELDKAGKVAQQYGATFAAVGYKINCKDKVKNECDAGVDQRNYWTINTTPDGFTYTVYGVPKDKKGDATAKVEKRHEFAFKAAK